MESMVGEQAILAPGCERPSPVASALAPSLTYRVA